MYIPAGVDLTHHWIGWDFLAALIILAVASKVFYDLVIVKAKK